MSQEESGPPVGGIAGRPIDEAVDAVVARRETDPETVRAALGHVSEDGVVSLEAAESSLAHLSKIVSTPETRAELAAIELSEAREAAAPVEDLDVVVARLEAFEARLAAVEEEVADLGTALQSLVERDGDPDALYEVARDIRRLTAGANRVHGKADELIRDVEEFERWVDTPARRFDALDGDLDALAAAFDDLERALDDLADGAERPGVAWADVALRHRVFDTLLVDVRAELADHRTWNDRVAADADGRLEAAADRLGTLTERQAALDDRLDALARDAWRETHGATLAALETDLANVEPPVDWAAVRATLEARRENLD